MDKSNHQNEIWQRLFAKTDNSERLTQEILSPQDDMVYRSE